MVRRLAATAVFLAAALISPAAIAGSPQTIDDFSSVAAWNAAPSEGVGLQIVSDAGRRGRAMRLDFDFHGGAGYAVAHRATALHLPDDFEIDFDLKGDSPPNNLEVKLIDDTGANVWWLNQRNYQFSKEWTKLRIRRRQFEFAWGPDPGRKLENISAIEIVVTAGSGLRGSVWVSGLTLVPREPPPAAMPAPSIEATSSAPGHGPALMLDGNLATEWRSADDRPQSIEIDFGSPREVGGLTIDWGVMTDRGGEFASQYEVDTSDDGVEWDTAYRVTRGNGGRDYILLTDSEPRRIRIRLEKSRSGLGFTIREVEIQPAAFGESRNNFFAAIAHDSPRGMFPKYFGDVQSYWTVAGEPGEHRKVLMNEEGTIEPERGGFSIEPFLLVDDALVTWADVKTGQSLEDGELPIPSVTWNAGTLQLIVTLIARPGDKAYVRYRIVNHGKKRKRLKLFLAIRPFQVNPPWQFLNLQGGTARIDSIAFDGRSADVDGRPVVPLTHPDQFGAAPFEAGDITRYLREWNLPAEQKISDSFGAASGAFEWSLPLSANATSDVVIELPGPTTEPPAVLSRGGASALASHELASARELWRNRLGRVTMSIPPSANRFLQAVHSSVAWIMVEQSGAAFQPGSRNYARSWIRDGSLMSAALLRLGLDDEVRSYIEWFAPFQFPSGKIPCCVDARGADPVPENDSGGEFLFLVAEYFRYTGDRSLLERVWPHVVRDVAYLDDLRQQRRTAEYQTGEKRAYFGLLPESISHEGYSAKPMHSYWDDFFALRGFKDAVTIALALGRTDDARRFAAIRDEFRGDLLDSIRLAMAAHKIDFIPGCVELGDFDPTSTTIGLAPGGELPDLDRAALERTFGRYYENFVQRRDGGAPWDDYTPYETRVIGTMARLGWPERAHELTDFFLRDLRPTGWNEWAEVVWHDRNAPKFIGDMPHAWVASDFVRSALDLFAYPTDEGTLVIGAGIPADWVAAGEKASIGGLRTPFGNIDLTFRGEADGHSISIAFGGNARPPGGVVIRAPSRPGLVRTLVDSRERAVSNGELRLDGVPGRVAFEY